MRVDIIRPRPGASVEPVFVAYGTHVAPERVVAILVSQDAQILGVNLTNAPPQGSQMWAVRFPGIGMETIPPGNYKVVALDIEDPARSASPPRPVRLRGGPVPVGPPIIDFPRAGDPVTREFTASGRCTGAPADVTCSMTCAGLGPDVFTGDPPALGEFGGFWTRLFTAPGSDIDCPLVHNNFVCTAGDPNGMDAQGGVILVDGLAPMNKMMGSASQGGRNASKKGKPAAKKKATKRNVTKRNVTKKRKTMKRKTIKRAK